MPDPHDGAPPSDGSEWWKPGHPWVHQTTGNNYRAWFSSVEDLTNAANKVYDSTAAQLPDGTKLMLSINGVAAMLLGFAIESALKGLWVRAGNKLIVNGKFTRPSNAGDHELGQLARVVSKQVHLPLTEEELNVLDRLSAFVVFAGRYPVPLRPDDMKEKKTPDGGKQVPTFFSDEDFQITRRLLNGFTTGLNPHIKMFKLANRNP